MNPIRVKKCNEGLVCYVVLASLLSLVLMTNLADKGSAYTPHSPIQILGNGDFTPANGVSSGTGTAADPFIIEGWEINVTSGAGAGIQILYTDAHFIIHDSFIHGPGKMSAEKGIILQGASNGTIQNTTLTGLETGIYTDYANNTAIAENNMTNNFWPVRAKHSTNLTLTGNTMSDQEYGIAVLQSFKVKATGNTIITPSQGIFLQQTPLSLVKRNNIISFSQFSIHIYFSDNSTVIENNLTERAGIGVEHSSNIAVSNNSAPIGSDSMVSAQFGGNISITNNSVSRIACFHCWDARIADNAVSSKNYSGISYRYSDRAVIARNKVSNSSQGVYLEKAVNTTIMNNTIASNGITLRGDALAEFRSHVITVDNLVNGKPVYYYRDCNGLNVDGIQLGQLIVVNCTGVGVANLLINDTDTAVQMAYVGDVIVEKLNLTSNRGKGLFLYNVDNAVIRNNDMSGNLEKGAELLDLSNATIEGNVFSGNGEGVFARVVDGNLSANVASGNAEHGMSMVASRSIIRANHADQNGYWGMALSYSANIRIEGNELSS
ncbi:MAG: right-handed parallel beta-helix repeat-containing protein, partial [Thermoplasmata archaeon]